MLAFIFSQIIIASILNAMATANAVEPSLEIRLAEGSRISQGNPLSLNIRFRNTSDQTIW